MICTLHAVCVRIYVCTVKDSACSKPTYGNTVHKVGEFHPDVLEVDHNENEQCATSVHAGSPYTATNSLTFNSDDDHTSPCEFGSSNIAASAQAYVLENDTSIVTYTSGVNCCIELDETCSDNGMCQNDHISCACDPTYNLQYNGVTVADSYCDTDSDLVSQSQGLTNSQKVKIFSLELDMMKVPPSAQGSQNSLFDSLTEMSAMLME